MSGDNICLRYDFAIPATQAFAQRGTPQSPAIYWLDVQAEAPSLGAQTPKFGWKTSILSWMDNAVWMRVSEAYFGMAWQKLVYPLGHPKFGLPLDLAFSVATTQSSSLTKWSQPPVTNRYVTIKWNAESTVHYQLQATTYLSNAPAHCVWSNVGPEVIGPVYPQGDPNSSATNRFYRVVAPNVAP